MWNRPRPPPYTHHRSNVVTSPLGANHMGNTMGAAVGNNNTAMTTSPVTSPRKRVLNSRYKNMSSRTPPKLKGHPRDTRPGRSRKSESSGSNSMRSSHHPTTTTHHDTKNNPDSSSHPSPPPPHHHNHPHYFREQCNFFPPQTDWAEALGFSVNSLWNCGAHGHMSPTSHSVSPRESNTVVATHTHNAPQSHHHGPAPNSTYGNSNYWYYEQQQQQQQEGRDPSSTGQRGYEEGYDRRRGSGVRDTVVM